jgi:integrase/recombinase XerD
MTAPRARPRLPEQPRQLDAGPLEPMIGSFALHLAAEGKAARTVQGYTSAVRWFATGYLLRQVGKTSWEQADAQDIQRWIVQLLDRYSGAYASIQFRALRQFFKWRAAEEELPDPMARLRAPKVTVTAVPVFTSVELSDLDKACQGRSFAARRDAAIIAVFTATGIRLSELAGIRHHPGDPARSDLDLQAREIRIRGKGGTARTVKIGHQAARSLDRYLRARTRHTQAHRPQLWLGVNNRGPLTATGIYQIVARRGRQCGVSVYPHRFPAPLQPHLAGPRRSRTRPDGTERLDLPADAHPVRRQRPRRPRPPQLRPHHGQHHLTPRRARHHPAAPDSCRQH